MTDLTTYRERFPAVREYEDHIANRRGMILKSDAVYREDADAALAALAKALGEAEAEVKRLREREQLLGETGMYQQDRADKAEARVAQLEAKLPPPWSNEPLTCSACGLETNDIHYFPADPTGFRLCPECNPGELRHRIRELEAELAELKGRHTAAGCGMDAVTGTLTIMTTGAELTKLEVQRCGTCWHFDGDPPGSGEWMQCVHPEVCLFIADTHGEPLPDDFACNRYERREG